MTIEQRTAETILETKKELTIDGHAYKVAPPTIGTLIMVSEVISTLPKAENIKNDGEILNAVLRQAKDYRAIADVASVLILGAKGLTEKVEIEERITHKRLFGLIRWTSNKRVTKEVNRRAELAERILLNISAKDLYEWIISILSGLDVSYFFAITTSLSDVNLLKPTREVG